MSKVVICPLMLVLLPVFSCIAGENDNNSAVDKNMARINGYLSEVKTQSAQHGIGAKQLQSIKFDNLSEHAESVTSAPDTRSVPSVSGATSEEIAQLIKNSDLSAQERIQLINLLSR